MFLDKHNPELPGILRCTSHLRTFKSDNPFLHFVFARWRELHVYTIKSLMLVSPPSGVLDGSPGADIFFAKEINHRFGCLSIIVLIKFHSYDFSPIPTFRSDRQVNPPRFEVGEYCDSTPCEKRHAEVAFDVFATLYHLFSLQ